MQFSDWRRPTGLVRQPDSMRTDYERFFVRPFTPRFGAELVGLSVNELDGATISLVRDAWMDWKVLVFRDQDITSDEQLAFALQFGQVDHHPYLAKGESEDLSVLDNPLAPPFLESNPPSERSGRWHSDATFRSCPPYGSFLLARILPSVGGDTLWADMEQVYEGLSDEVKSLIDGRTATHSLTKSSFVSLKPEDLEAELERFPPQHHPIVRTHPVTGRKSLYVNSVFVDHVDGLQDDLGQKLLAHLGGEVHKPEYQMRLGWEVGSLAMWDNRCTQHCAVYDYYERRRVERVTLAGERPV